MSTPSSVLSARGFSDDMDSSDNGQSLVGQLDLQHYLRILRKHKWPIVLFTAAVTTLAGYYAYTATPIYSATSTLLIEDQGGEPIAIEELVGIDTQSQDYYQTQFELLRSRGLAVRVIEHMDLWDHPELSSVARETEIKSDAARAELIGDEPTGVSKWLNVASEKISELTGDSAAETDGSVTLDLANLDNGSLKPTSSKLDSAFDSFTTDDTRTEIEGSILEGERKRVVGSFRSRVTIAPIRKTKLVKISFESADPEFAASVANIIGEQYIESHLDAKLELTTKASTWLNERLTTLKATLDESEDRLIAFKQANGLVDVDNSVARLNEQELLLVTAELAQARSEFSGKADLYRDVQSLGNQPNLLQSIPAVQADSLVQFVKVELGKAQRELDELRNRYGARHPRVVDATSQIATLNSTLEGHINRVVGTISKDYQLARQRVVSIESKLAAGKQEIQAIGTKKFELDELEREVQTNRTIYDTFFSRISEAKSTDGLDNANARISDPAVAPARPIKPKKQLIVALAGLASLVLSMLMAFLYEQMDDTIKGTEDVEDKLGVNLLGILPLVKGGMFSRSNSLPLDPTDIPDSKGQFAEAVNTARTTLCMNDKDQISKVIMVTSSVPGEGKSTTAINLAYSLAQLERVLIIDCDMRRPTLAKAAGIDKNIAGLSSLISGTAPARQCIKRGVFDGTIDILPSGPIPEQPLELLSSRRFERIVAQLSEHYDRIVIDSAPTQAVSDALVLSQVSDAVVYVVKSHETSIDLVRRGLQRLKQINAPVAGVIISQVDIDKITSYGGDHYYQGYYDYYGYTEKGTNARGGGKLKLSQEELLAIRTDDSDDALDLDFGLGSRTARQNDSHLYSVEDSFDLTTDLTAEAANVSPRANGMNGGGRSRRVGGRGDRLRDDLDIL